MPLQYISDHSGKQTAVLIPINEWEQIKQKHQDLKELEKPKEQQKEIKPSDFAGSMSADVANNFNNYIKEARQQWD
jgi:hypothetical protein